MIIASSAPVSYTHLYGHFLHLLTLFDSVEKVRFFLDQDSGMRAACLGAFAGRIKDRRCDAFYVRIAKNLTAVSYTHLDVYKRQEFFRDFARRHPLSPATGAGGVWRRSGQFLQEPELRELW